jgi:hypothetical protein
MFMSLTDIQKAIFCEKHFVNGEVYYEYESSAARGLHTQGVNYKKLSIAKWMFILECKRKKIYVSNLDSRCGYCFEYAGCGNCPCSGQFSCCDEEMPSSSSRMCSRAMRNVLKCVQQGQIPR